MSLLGKLCLSLSGLSLIIMMSTSWILGGWLNVLYIFLALFFLGIILSFLIDYNLYLGFLLMRTTKNGMSMGVSILITLVFCASLAYLSTRFKTSVDITEERINSLAPQTIQLLKNLDQDMDLIVFYKGGAGNQKKEMVKKNLTLLKQKSSKIKDRYYDAHLKNKLAQEYLNELPGKDSENIFVFVEYKGKKVLVDFPFDEGKLVSSMIKATRRQERTIYFLSGHEERGTSNTEGAGISEFKDALVRSSFQVKTWSFVTNGPLPKDVSALVIAGPQKPYLEKEIQWLEEYLDKGGRMFVALDPDKDHSLTSLLKQFGVNYTSRYVMDRIAALMGLGQLSPLGVYFDKASVITSSFQQGSFSVFHIASNLEITDTKRGPFAITELVKTNENAISVPSIEGKVEGKRSAHVIAMLVEESKEFEEKTGEKEDPEKADKANNKEPSMKLAVFGDSDFLSNDFINSRGLNRDLIMNTISYLVDESDLVSIRPKRLKATQLILKSSDQMGMVFFSIALPIIFFIFSFIIWFRRREA
ncbi:MAG: GldG family protein [Bdellovibrionales bacterium]|nr:GldG family protein [Bdellovibrionales bacterium]